MTSSATGGAAPGSVVVGAPAPGEMARLFEAAAEVFDAAATAAVMLRETSVEVVGTHGHDGPSAGSAVRFVVSRLNSSRACVATLQLSSSLGVHDHDALTALMLSKAKAAEVSEFTTTTL